jgi:cytochrome c-type biogenesis protein CcmH
VSTVAPRAAGGRRPRADSLVVVLASAVVLGTLLVVGASGRSTSSDVAVRAHEVAAGLRCPVCQDLSAADSPAPMAAQMRRQILQDLQQGRSPEQIRSKFVSAYGNSVLMSPPRHGLGAVAYALPLLVLLVAGSAGGVLLRKWLRRPAGEALDTGGASAVDAGSAQGKAQEVAR